MDFEKLLADGVSDYLLDFSKNFKKNPYDVLSVFRYWTIDVMMEILKNHHDMEFERNNEILKKLNIDKELDEKQPIVSCEVKKPIESFMIFAINPEIKSSSPLTVTQAAHQLLDTTHPIFHYHIFIFSKDARFLFWEHKPFIWNSQQVYELINWISNIYKTFDYHELTQTSSIYSLTCPKYSIFSIGASTVPSPTQTESKQNPNVPVTSTVLEFSKMIEPLLNQMSLVPNNVYFLVDSKSPYLEKIKNMNVLGDNIQYYSIENDKFNALASSLPSLFEEIHDTLEPIFQKLNIPLTSPDFTQCMHFLLMIALLVKDNPTNPLFIILIVSFPWKFFIDSLINKVLLMTDSTIIPGQVRVNLLLPNTNWLPDTIFLPFRLPDFPWLPNLLHSKKDWWFTSAKAIPIYEKVLKKIPQPDLEPCLSKDRTRMCIWNQKKKKCENTIYYDSDKKSITFS